MSLWISLLWVAYAAVSIAAFVLCRKRVADIAHQVADETDHRIKRVVEAERSIDEQLCQAFVGFQDPAEAIQGYKTAQANIEGVPRTNPPWRWTADDLEQSRRITEGRETARRCRPPVVTAIITVLAVTLAAAVATVVLSNSVRPELATQVPPAAVANPPVNPLVPTANPPPLPVAIPAPIPTPSPTPVLPQPAFSATSGPGGAGMGCATTQTGGNENE